MLTKDDHHILAALAEEDLGLPGALIDRTWDLVIEAAKSGRLQMLTDVDEVDVPEVLEQLRGEFNSTLRTAIQEYTEDREAFWQKNGHLE